MQCRDFSLSVCSLRLSRSSKVGKDRSNEKGYSLFSVANSWSEEKKNYWFHFHNVELSGMVCLHCSGFSHMLQDACRLDVINLWFRLLSQDHICVLGVCRVIDQSLPPCRSYHYAARVLKLQQDRDYFCLLTKGQEDVHCRKSRGVLISHSTSAISRRPVSRCSLSPNLSLFMHTRNSSFASVQTPTEWPDLCIFTQVSPSSRFPTQPSAACVACEARN